MTQVQVSMIGTGYVGLTNAVALAYLGHHVTCVDVDAKVQGNILQPVHDCGSTSPCGIATG